jgi:hypothetical protein
MRKNWIPLVVFLSVVVPLGCTADQVTKYNAGVADIQQKYIATTQAVAEAQTVEQQARDAVAALPADSPARKVALDALAKADKAFNVAKANEAKTKAALDAAVQIGQSLQTGNPADLSGLTAFGPYGLLAAAGISLVLNLYQRANNSGLLAKLAHHQEALAAVAGTTNPAEALGAAYPTPVRPDTPAPDVAPPPAKS